MKMIRNSEKQQIITAFIEVGHSHAYVAIAKFTADPVTQKVTAKVLCSESDKNLGGRDQDWLLLEHFSANF